MISRSLFRNVKATPEDPIETWPYEVYAAALQYGDYPDWRFFAAEIERDPWGHVAELMNTVIHELPNLDGSQIFFLVIGKARQDSWSHIGYLPGRDPNFEPW